MIRGDDNIVVSKTLTIFSCRLFEVSRTVVLRPPRPKDDKAWFTRTRKMLIWVSRGFYYEELMVLSLGLPSASLTPTVRVSEYTQQHSAYHLPYVLHFDQPARIIGVSTEPCVVFCFAGPIQTVVGDKKFRLKMIQGVSE